MYFSRYQVSAKFWSLFGCLKDKDFLRLPLVRQHPFNPFRREGFINRSAMVVAFQWLGVHFTAKQFYVLDGLNVFLVFPLPGTFGAQHRSVDKI